MKRYYDEAAAANSTFSAQMSFERWLSFLAPLVATDADRAKIKLEGREFVKYVVDPATHGRGRGKNEAAVASDGRARLTRTTERR